MSSDLPVRDDGWADYDERAAVQRCPQCGKTFRVLADERGMHDCPRCGASPHDDEGDDE